MGAQGPQGSILGVQNIFTGLLEHQNFALAQPKLLDFTSKKSLDEALAKALTKANENAGGGLFG